MKYIYIASPYVIGDRQANVLASLDAANELMDRGFVPFCPLLCHYWQIYCPRDEKEWRNYSLSWVTRCDALVRLPGESEGADLEVRAAQQSRIPIYYGVQEFIVLGRSDYNA